MLELYVPPNYHLKLPSNKMGRRHISAPILKITWTEMDRQKWPNRLASYVARFNPTGFLLLGLCEEHCLPVKINDLQHLKARIKDSVATVTLNMLQATWNEVEYRLDICRAIKGAHIEIY
jgi:hypothetical protein